MEMLHEDTLLDVNVDLLFWIEIFWYAPIKRLELDPFLDFGHFEVTTTLMKAKKRKTGW